jgi:ABC-type transport system involved in cytochrome bd biosynthesis fused ATPase/permease subunit
VTLGGVEVRDLTGEQVRSRVGFVDDDPHVFATTLGANTRLARLSASDEEVTDSLMAVGLGPLLATMPRGLETELGDVTTGLSGGERRRLGVARALLARRPVMILDEPTEGLDGADARSMIREVCRRQGDGIVVVISHHDHDRLGATVQLTIEDGVVREVRAR